MLQASAYEAEDSGPVRPRSVWELGGLVYSWCMARTNIDVDDDACRTVMQRYHLSTKREAVNLALRLVAAEALSEEDARALRGSGWEGNLEELRSSRTS